MYASNVSYAYGWLKIQLSEPLEHVAGLYPLLHTSIQLGKKAYFKHDKLVVNNDTFYYGITQKRVCNVLKQVIAQRSEYKSTYEPEKMAPRSQYMYSVYPGTETKYD